MIGFTGHRDKLTTFEEILTLQEQYPNETFVLGGAPGFDTQIEYFCLEYNHPFIVIRPSNLSRKWKYLERDRTIVDTTDRLYALYDGREKGGTFYTKNYALQKGKEVIFLKEAKSLDEAYIGRFKKYFERFFE